jgi:serine/threonine-protein kinase
MPRLIGLSDAEARAELNAKRFTKFGPGAPVSKDNCDQPTVATQSPNPGTQIPLDQQITYQLCQLPSTVTVPDNLVSAKEDLAKSTLERLGLKFDSREVDSDKAKGTVVAVEKAGQQVPRGTEITVSISKQNLFGVPRVIDKTEQEAIDELEAAGFNARSVKGAPSATPGIVTEQSPGSDKPQPKGRTITIVISQPLNPNPDPTGTPDPDPTTPGGNGGGDNGGTVGNLLGRRP